MRSIDRPSLLHALPLLLLCAPAFANEHDFALRDPEIDKVIAPAADVLGALEGDAQPYFIAPIPSIIHHVWFGDPARFERDRSERWQQLASLYGYAYHLWTPDDDPHFQQIMGDDLFFYMQRLRREGRYDAASDICRYALLESMGGIYIDVDVNAPELNGELVDLRQILPLNGLVIATENYVREVGNSAFYSRNDIIMAAPHHPVLQQILATILPNAEHYVSRGGNWNRGAQFFTGQILWNMTLNGPFTVIPVRYLREFNINWERRPDLDDYLQRRRRQVCGGPYGCEPLHSIHH